MYSYVKKVLICISLLLVLVSCSNNTLIESEAPEFELLIVRSGQDLYEGDTQKKDGLIIETSFWDEENEKLSDDEILSFYLNLQEENNDLKPYEVVLDKYLVNFDFSQAKDKPNYYIAVVGFEGEEGGYWQGDIPDNGIYGFSPPDPGAGITKAMVIFQWIDEDSVVMGQQIIRFNLKVLEN
ncbi:hypothetical protein [Amphibacillus sediminis]|uniref:hypothetical protein n=1 Tax=Amphibacillus sediminis TaxID=360185 RepID=UPI000830708F|nr:hypothetical protein [Amphibacillus sediminis]